MILFVENDPQCPTGLYGKLLTEWQVSHSLWRAHVGEPCPPLQQVSGTIILGGAMGVEDEQEHPHLLQVKYFLQELITAKLPCLGICLGGQLLAEALGGAVHSACSGEKGGHPVTLTRAGRQDPLFVGLPEEFSVFQWHNDSFDVPSGAIHLAFSNRCPGQALRVDKAWGVQFHPEIELTIATSWWQLETNDPDILIEFRRREAALRAVGEQLLRNFMGICGA